MHLHRKEKKVHYKKVKGILSSSNGMNLYRGCLHGCIYCDSRSDCYHMDHLFEDIEVKENALELLDASLKKKRKPCMIGMGAMTDPYIPLEDQLLYTRGALEIIDRNGFGVTLITKSSRVLRDLDVLKSIQTHSKCVIQMTLTTYDEDLCKILEPNVSTTKERFETLLTLYKEGIPTIVWLTPILPFINNNEGNLRGILDYCIKAHVKGIICFDMGVTLREGNREYFYSKLEQHFPGLKETYINKYGNSYILSSPQNKQLMRIFHQVCEENGIMHEHEEIFNYLRTYEDHRLNLLDFI